MLTKVMMQEIQDLKLQGYAMNEIASYYEGKGINRLRRQPSRNTT